MSAELHSRNEKVRKLESLESFLPYLPSGGVLLTVFVLV